MTTPILHLALDNALGGYGSGGVILATGNGALRFRDSDIEGRRSALIEEGTINFWDAIPGPTTGTHFDFNTYRTLIPAVRDTSDPPPNGAVATRMTNNNLSHMSGPMARITYDPVTPADGAYLFWVSFDIKGGLGNWMVGDASNFVNTTYTFASSPVWVRRAGPLTLPDVYTPRTGTDLTIGGTVTAPSAPMLIANVQAEYKDHATTFALGDMGAGYSWNGAAYNSSSTRAVTTLDVPCATTPAHIFGRYSEDLGETWATLEITGSGGAIGTYGTASHAASTLTIASSRSLLIRDLVVYGSVISGAERDDVISDIVGASFTLSPEELYPLSIMSQTNEVTSLSMIQSSSNTENLSVIQAGE